MNNPRQSSGSAPSSPPSGGEDDGKKAPPPADGPARRPYHSPVRRQRAAETRDRILGAGSALVHEYPSWDWRELTFRAVAERAGVSERTVFRHFATERDLHRALMARLHEEAGVDYRGVSLDRLPAVTERVFASFRSFAAWADHQTPPPPFRDIESLRESSVRAAVDGAVTEDWTPQQREAAAGALDVLWSAVSYEHLTATWGLSPDDATRTLTWAMEVVADAIRTGRRP